jgi:MFS transporter, MCT family, solute carrier family 16 (monocarboxylic acid transporters), member 10
MMFAFMSTGALAGTPVGGVFIKQPTVEHFKTLILFSVSQFHWRLPLAF